MSLKGIDLRWGSIGEARGAGLDDAVHQHWREVESHQDEIPLDIDWPKYLMLERLGIYRPFTAWSGAELVGYNAFFVQPVMHHRTTVWAINDVLYLAPEHRRGLLGAQLIKGAEPGLRAMRVKKVLYDSKERVYLGQGKARGTLSRLLVALGYEHLANVHEKLL